MYFTRILAATLIGMPGALRQSMACEASRLAQATAPAASQPAAAPKKKSWAVRNPILLGALLGAGGGAAIAQLADSQSARLLPLPRSE